LSTSSAIISLSSAANSTPVGPPPQMTNDSRRFRSSGKVVGKAASSRLAEVSKAASGADIANRKCHGMILTHDSASDSLGIGHSLELIAVFQAFHSVVVRGRSNSNDQFVVYQSAQSHIGWQSDPRASLVYPGISSYRDDEQRRANSTYTEHMPCKYPDWYPKPSQLRPSCPPYPDRPQRP
jgi:hypothetical protein